MMIEVIKTKAALDARLSEVRKEGKTVGLVPTMGALHAGHASLVERSVRETDLPWSVTSLIPPNSMTRTT